MYHQVKRRLPAAVAVIKGTGRYAAVNGTLRLYDKPNGVMVETVLSGLPLGHGACDHPVFGFHIHGGASCSGTASDAFADAGTHYNPRECPHPYHAGDMPPVFGVKGTAYSVFLTDRFTVRDVLGKTVILHDRPDDFTTQPSGNAGNKIACGVIGAVRR